jgi:hypothetical protein
LSIPSLPYSPPKDDTPIVGRVGWRRIAEAVNAILKFTFSNQPMTLSETSDGTLLTLSRTGGTNDPALTFTLTDATGATINLTTAQTLSLAINGANVVTLSDSTFGSALASTTQVAFTLGAAVPQMAFVNSLASTNLHNWDQYASSGGVMHYRQVNDAYTVGLDYLVATSNGSAITNIQVPDDGGTLQTVGFRGVPINSKTANYTLQLSDRGKCVELTTNGSFTVTVPENIFSAGDVVTLAAFQGTDTYTIAAGTGVTLYWGNGTVTTGNRTLTSVGIATIVFMSATTAIITGSALS